MELGADSQCLYVEDQGHRTSMMGIVSKIHSQTGSGVPFSDHLGLCKVFEHIDWDPHVCCCWSGGICLDVNCANSYDGVELSEVIL